MGETQTPHFYDFRIFEPGTKPQHQLFSLKKTVPKPQKYRNEVKENPQTF